MPAADVNLQAQFDEYVQFVRDRLRPDHEALLRAEQEIETEIRDYEDLIDRLNELVHKEDMETMKVDLGHGKVFCRAKLDDSSPRVIYVHVGMGFHVEFKFQEALQWIPKRIEYLESTVLAHRRSKTKKVWVHLQSSERILDELSLELSRIK